MLTLHREEPKPAPRQNVCRLTLDIGGTLYKVAPIRSEGGQLHGFKFTREDNGTAYTLTSLGCSCPSDRYRKPGQVRCKHYRSAKACGLDI